MDVENAAIETPEIEAADIESALAEAVAEAMVEPVEAPAADGAAPAAPVVSDSDFETVVNGALEAVHGVLLFKMRVGGEAEGEHVAAALVGSGAGRQFLLLTLPLAGGKLKVEMADRSESPLARIAASYAGLAETFRAAA